MNFAPSPPFQHTQSHNHTNSNFRCPPSPALVVPQHVLLHEGDSVVQTNKKIAVSILVKMFGDVTWDANAYQMLNAVLDVVVDMGFPFDAPEMTTALSFFESICGGKSMRRASRSFSDAILTYFNKVWFAWTDGWFFFVCVFKVHSATLSSASVRVVWVVWVAEHLSGYQARACSVAVANHPRPSSCSF